jgi:hypothetical protein
MVPPVGGPSMKRTSRHPAALPASFNRQLTMYALAAGAAGVGGLALAQPAEAKIVYTPANISIPLNGGLVQIDLNKDGVNDFALSNYSYQTHGLGDLFLKVVEDQSSNEIVDAKSKGHVCAAALPKGAKVGPKSRFHQDPTKGLYMRYVGLGGTQSSGTRFGPWFELNGQRYLGLKFVVNGKTHYGWARVKVISGSVSTTLTGYAYETIPGKPIIAGATKGPDEAEPTASLKPATLGALAMGAPGLSIWRREESVGAIS